MEYPGNKLDVQPFLRLMGFTGRDIGRLFVKIMFFFHFGILSKEWEIYEDTY